MAYLGALKFIIIPLISAFIGWMTNWVAVKMLFHPKKPINLYFFTLHGIFHRKQKQLAHNLGTTIEEQLFSHDDIQEILNSKEFIDGISESIAKYIDDFIENRLRIIIPMISVLPNEFVTKTKAKIVEEFEKFLPHLMKSAEEGLQEHLSVKDLIREKIENFEVEQLEDILFSILKDEFKQIEYIGGILGFFIGLSQLILIQYL
jgi:uncharacterized membrane protein YheB (UPF0754 family)